METLQANSHAGHTGAAQANNTPAPEYADTALPGVGANGSTKMRDRRPGWKAWLARRDGPLSA
jgi:hypothetical protein